LCALPFAMHSVKGLCKLYALFLSVFCWFTAHLYCVLTIVRSHFLAFFKFLIGDDDRCM
jgi:hypothetical protein